MVANEEHVNDYGQAERLQEQLKAKQLEVEELQELLQSEKLVHEQQAAELNAKELLIARKNEHIEELEVQLGASQQDLEAEVVRTKALQAHVEALEKEIQELQDQRQKDEEDFTMLQAAMETKETQVQKKSEEISQARDIEAKLYKDIERHQALIRRLEKDVADLQPEKADVCLSPRSFSENQLIRLRDETINAKTKEVWMLMGQNDDLRAQLDELEAELEKLQSSYVSKENEVARKDHKLEKLRNELDALRVARQQAEGREKAFEIATTQNTKLLQALQAQEAETEELRAQVERLQSELDYLRKSQRDYLEKSAAQEVDVQHKSKLAEEKASALSALQGKLHRERSELHQELHDARIKYQVELDKVQAELTMRRNKQYELTWKLQETERKLHDATDELERVSERFIATQWRMEEAERVLNDAVSVKKKLEDQLAHDRKASLESNSHMDAKLAQVHSEGEALKRQLDEARNLVLKAREAEKQHNLEIRESKRKLEVKDKLIGEQKERISRLVQEMHRESTARVYVENEVKLLREQLEKIREQMENTVRDFTGKLGEASERQRQELARYEQLQAEYQKEHRGKSRLVQRHMSVLKICASQSLFADTIWQPTLDLSDLWLADHDLAPVLSALESSPEKTSSVDLRANRITQDGMKLILHYYQKQKNPPRIKQMDLRQNLISMEGVRVLANGLEKLLSSTHSSWFHSVVVHNGGRIECSTRDPTQNPLHDSQALHGTTRTAFEASNEPVLCIDARCNYDANLLVVQLKNLTKRRETNLKEELVSHRDLELSRIYGNDYIINDKIPIKRRETLSDIKHDEHCFQSLRKTGGPSKRSGSASVPLLPRISRGNRNDAQE